MVPDARNPPSDLFSIIEVNVKLAQRAAGSLWRPSWRICECKFAMARASDGAYRCHFLSEFLQPYAPWPGCLALGIQIP